jgi:hypothetical protein
MKRVARNAGFIVSTETKHSLRPCGQGVCDRMTILLTNTEQTENTIFQVVIKLNKSDRHIFVIPDVSAVHFNVKVNHVSACLSV